MCMDIASSSLARPYLEDGTAGYNPDVVLTYSVFYCHMQYVDGACHYAQKCGVKNASGRIHGGASKGKVGKRTSNTPAVSSRKNLEKTLEYEL